MIPLSSEGAEWTDQLTVTMKATDRFEVFEDDQIVISVDGGEAWPRTWLKDELRQLGVDPVNHEPTYMLQDNSSETSWGADGSAVDILLQVGEAAWDGILAAGAYDLFRKMVDKLKASRQENFRPITEEEAESRARWAVETKYDLTPEKLALVSVELDGTTKAVVVLTCASPQTTYEVQLVSEGLMLTMSRIKRTVG